MQIFVNGDDFTTKAKTLAELLEFLDLRPQVVTVTLNGTVHRADRLTQTRLRENDQVEIVMFMGGGS